MLKGIKSFYYIFIIFLLINSFYIIKPITSSIAAPLVALFCFIFVGRKKTIPTSFFKQNRQMLTVLFYVFLMLLVNLLIPLIYGTLDLSYLKNVASQLVQFFLISITLILICQKDLYVTNNIEKLIVLTFVLQSIIQILAFIFPSVASFVHLTYTAEKIQRLYDDYAGVRGLALTGSPGWGLSIGYALSFLLYTKAFLVDRKVTIFAIVVGLLLIIGAFFAGRSAFIGVLLSLIYFFVSTISFKQKIKSFLYFLLLTTLMLFFAYFAFSNFWLLLETRVFPFVFEFYYKFSEGGSLSTNSTDILASMWDLDVTLQQLLFGTGMFSDPISGDYFMGTDVGYIRNSLYGGVVFVLIIFLYQFVLLGGLYLKKYPMNEKKLIHFIFFMAMVLEAKAMTIGFNKYLFTISLLLSISYYIRYSSVK